MKKVNVVLREGSAKTNFYLFPSVESLYEWSSTPEGKPRAPIEGLDVIELNPGQFFEAEWLGCEYAYDGPTIKKFDFVRLAMSHESKNSSGTVVTMHYGWIEDSWIPFYDVETSDLVIKRLANEDCQLNMPKLFPEDQDVDVSELEDK